MNKKINFHIDGLHCRACKTLIETDLKDRRGVKHIDVDFQSGASVVEYDEQKISLEEIFSAIKKLNYLPHYKKTPSGKNKFLPLIIFGTSLLLLGLGYWAIDQFGGFSLLEKLNEKNISYSLILLLGLLAGFHCVGMCGGFVIAYSTKAAAKKRKSWAPHLEYNLGRLISYTVIGGILGGLGSFFGVDPTFTGVVTLIAGVIMIMMGLSFLTNWSPLKKIQLPLPDFIARYVYKQKNEKKSKGPFLIGLLTGFMPCGPLQAVELYALTSGDPLQGALSMGIYALGTTVILFIFGLTVSALSQRYLEKIVKISGVLVVVLGILMIGRGITNFNFNTTSSSDTDKETVASKTDIQEVTMNVDTFGYDPEVISIVPDKPVRWKINVIHMTSCTNAIEIASLGISRKLKYGENIIEFTPPKDVSEIKFSCGMQMVWGKFVIKGQKQSTNTTSDKNLEVGNSGTCSMSAGTCSCGNKN